MHEVVILNKGDMYSSLAIDTDEREGFIGRFDPRIREMAIVSYDNLQECEEDFEENVFKSVENGWTVEYRGQANWG